MNSSSSDSPSIQPAMNSSATMAAIALITRVRMTPLVCAPIEYTATTEPRNAAPPTPMNSATTSAVVTTTPVVSGRVRRQYTGAVPRRTSRTVHQAGSI